MKKEIQKFVIHHSDKSSFISYNDVLYCGADGAYCNIYTVDGDIVQISKTLAVVSKMLDLPFILRVSQSFLVNVHYVKHVMYKEKMIVLTTGDKLRFTVSAKVIEGWIMDVYSPEASVDVTNKNL